MKNVLLFLSFCAIALTSPAQNFSELKDIPLEEAEDYKPAEEKVLACSNYLFNNPANKEEQKRQRAIRFIMRWMEGTPHFTFNLDEKAMKLIGGEANLLGLYLAAMAKVAIEHPKIAGNTDQMNEKAIHLLLDYSSDRSNKVEKSEEMKRLIRRNNSGT